MESLCGKEPQQGKQKTRWDAARVNSRLPLRRSLCDDGSVESAPQPAVSILIACRNEEDNILPCLESVAAALPDAEILVIDGGRDRTSDRAETLARRHPRIRVLRHAGDRGKGHAIQTGIAQARAAIMAQFDADLQFQAADLPALLAPVQAGASDLCVGSRFLPGADWTVAKPTWCRDLGNRLLARWVSLLTGQRVTDVTSGMKAWSRAAIARIDFRDTAYSYEVEMVVRAARLGLRIREIPVHYASRTAGVSMHRNLPALAKAGGVIAWKSLRARWRQD